LAGKIFSVEKKTKSFGGKIDYVEIVCAFKGSLVFIKNYSKSFGGKIFALEKKVCAFEWSLILSQKIF